MKNNITYAEFLSPEVTNEVRMQVLQELSFSISDLWGMDREEFREFILSKLNIDISSVRNDLAGMLLLFDYLICFSPDVYSSNLPGNNITTH